MSPSHRPRRDPIPFVLGIACGGALLSLVAVEGGSLVSTLPLESLPGAEYGIRATERAVEAAELQGAGRDGVSALLATLGGLTLLLALGTTAILITARGSLRAHEVAVRASLGAPPGSLLRRLLRLDAGPLLGRGLPLGLVGAALGALTLRLAWPVPGAWVPGLLGIPAILAGVGVAAGAALLPLRYGRGRIAGMLGAGGRASSGPREGGMRRILTVAQLVGSLALLATAATLVRAAPSDVGADGGDASTALVHVSLAADLDDADRRAVYRELVDRARRLSTVRSESIATPGAWSGLGRRDFALADCGSCVRGGLWVPFLGEDAFQHVVSPGFFEAAGVSVLQGRDFGDGDRDGAERVAVVNEAFALRNFENGRPVGRKLRVGRTFDSWYTVVGVVGDVEAPALGRYGVREPAVYLSAWQHPPDRAVLSLAAAGGGALPSPAALLAGLPVTLDEGPPTEAALRRRDVGPLRWAGAAAAAAGMVAFLVAVVGVRAVARIEVEARRRELGVRMALGADPAGVRRWVLERSLRAALLASVLATLPAIALAARLEEVVGSLPLFDPVLFPVLAAAVTGAAVAGARSAAEEAGRTEPGVVMKEE